MLAEIHSGARVPPAVRHPLGFTCVQLYRSTAWGLCMHVWESGQAPITLTTSPIHSHSWDLSSQVFCGQLENIEVQVRDSPSSPTHRILEITSSGGTDRINPTDRLVCRTHAESVWIEAGENYTLPAGTFHMSRPGADGLTATIVLAENRDASPELVLGRLDSQHHVVARWHNSVADLRQMARAALRDLPAQTTGRPLQCYSEPPGGAPSTSLHRSSRASAKSLSMQPRPQVGSCAADSTAPSQARATGPREMSSHHWMWRPND